MAKLNFKNLLIDILGVDFRYPIGSYYETSDVDFDPNTAWGGTWVKEVAGQVHVSAGTGYTVSGANNNTSDGGESEHTLTIAEMPSHGHLQAHSILLTSLQVGMALHLGNLQHRTDLSAICHNIP